MDRQNISCLSVFCFVTLIISAKGHNTPCNTNNDTACLEGVRQEFVRTDYWFGDGYTNTRNVALMMTFAWMTSDGNHTNIASRLLGHSNFNVSTIQQFLRIRFNTPKGSYVSCGHRFDVDANVMDIDLDNTHTIYLDSWILGHRPTVTFNPTEGQSYTLVAYDAGYFRLGGIWVNIQTGDSATGQEMYPYMGPVNPVYTRNPFVFALFKQTAGNIADIEGQRKTIMQTILDNNGFYYLDTFIRDNNLEGPVAIGYIVINNGPYSIQYFVNRNIYNNCPYLVSKQTDVVKALQVMGYRLTADNSYSDYRGKFLTRLELDLSVIYISPEAHFESCCEHSMMMTTEVSVDPQDSSPIMALYTRNQPYIKLTPIQMDDKTFVLGQLYTLFLVDATDAVNNVSSPNVIIHWQVVNIPGDSVERGDTVLPYLFPMPLNRTEVRTFLFLLLKQTSRVDAAALWSYTGTNCDSRTVLRCRFNLGSFLQHLNFKLVGVSVFRSQQDSFIRAVQYGSVDPQRMASTMSQFMSMPKPDVQPHMSKVDACQGVPGYSDPCPAACASGPNTDHNHDMMMVTTSTAAPTTADMHMGHDHGK